ncbi:hypothetical protein [Streptomyces hirsutus]|uniref:hypothetical protein n=1 Tax=Streptomyces hirsutus TaxID=35620 RepID=UPI0036BE6D86
MYSTAAELALDADLVRSVVAERLAWEAASLPRDAAAERIGWHWSDLDRMGREGRITTGRGGRYLIADLDRLAEEADGEPYITAQAAASDVLEIRASDWKYVEAAGWVTPADTYERWVGRSRTVTVALYRLGDVRALRDVPGVDWEAARGLPKGVPSPLREYAKFAPTRAAVARAFAQDLADRHGVTVWAWNSPYSGLLGELDWERIEDASPRRPCAGSRPPIRRPVPTPPRSCCAPRGARSPARPGTCSSRTVRPSWTPRPPTCSAARSRSP